MDRARLLAPGLWMMTLAPLVVSIRALLALLGAQEPSFYWTFFALGGTLSGLGMILIATSSWQSPRFWIVVVGAAVALLGHNVVSRLPIEAIANAGPSLVHFGTAIIMWPFCRPAVASAIVAGVGAYLRWHYPIAGNSVLLLGALGLFVTLILTARAFSPEKSPESPLHTSEQ